MNPRVKAARWYLALLGGLASTAVGQSASPSITSIRSEGTNLVVTATVPAGVRRVTLETSDRLGRLSWAPRAVLRPMAQGGVVTFRVPVSRPFELIRVRADATEPLPGNFYQGTNDFSAPTDTSSRGSMDTTAGPGFNGGGETIRDVVESDIWKIHGNTLYFFNQYRGLQVIDITDPDRAFVRGTVELPAAGDQMYLLGTNYVVLLARDSCNYDQSQVLVVHDTNGPPQIIARLPVTGTIAESRLVGTALYVASQTSRPVDNTTNSVWEWGTMVSAFDLADPEAPVTRNTLWYPGYGNVVSATDTYLFVVTQAPTNWWQSVVNLVDITDPGGRVAVYASIRTTGQVHDKFKLNYAGTVFAAISEDWHDSTRRPVTRLETFHLPDPRAAGPGTIARLGSLELGHGERLHATRYDGSRVYIVTFMQIDPLWVVDFSDPRAPRIAGHVEVPGWSTYIHPLGDRLITLGIETNAVSVSLYDVSNPATPSRLSQVRLGTHYSWSEANQDEKAFTVLPEAGLLLVPFSGDTTNGYTSALQLIDFSRTLLTARGQVQSSSGLSYRRATVVNRRILSLSNWELVSVEATDRDNPQITGRLRLAETVDRLILSGDYLLRLSTGNGWDLTTPVLGVAPTAAPELILNRMELPSLPLLAASPRDGRLYLAQGTPGSEPGSNDAVFALTTLSLTNLPSLPVVSQSVTNIGYLGWSRDWQALWPKPGVLVWAGGAEFWWWYDMGPVRGGGFAGPINSFWPYWRGTGGSGHLVAFDASSPDAPQFASQVDLSSTNRWGFSQAFSADGLIYLSHQTMEYIRDPDQTNSGTYLYRSLLDVVDFAEPNDPLVREPVSIPNPLVGVAHSGALLYTLGAHWTTNGDDYGREYLEGSAYDGVKAHLVGSLALPAMWPHPVHVLGNNILIGNPGDADPTNTVPPVLETWTLSNTGSFVRLGAVNLTSPAFDILSFPGLLAVGDVSPGVKLFDPSDPAKLRLVGSGTTGLCWWWPDLAHADGDLAAGLWVPLSAYGVTHISSRP